MQESNERRQYWERIVADQQSSGLNGRKWCQANGIALASFYIWRRKLAATPPGGAERRNSDIRWLAVEPSRSVISSTSAGVTIRVGGVSVDVAGGFDRRALADVLSVLESRC